MALSHYITPKNTTIFSVAALTSFIGVRYRARLNDRREPVRGNYYVSTARSGGGI
ncbi:hypothetical protein AAFC00_006832 [Neodothiora populina]|uniref:Uncharacterized protein n=1 Tax=Neodothiora populina TaxID=2781224 RepID=A0ABR3PBY0_9PEZI